MATKIRFKMQEFDFKPPPGSVYVTFTEDPEFKETSSGIHAKQDLNPRRSMVATVAAVGGGVEDVQAGMNILFNRSRAIMVKEGVYCVKEEFIEAEVPCIP